MKTSNVHYNGLILPFGSPLKVALICAMFSSKYIKSSGIHKVYLVGRYTAAVNGTQFSCQCHSPIIMISTCGLFFNFDLKKQKIEHDKKTLKIYSLANFEI